MNNSIVNCMTVLALFGASLAQANIEIDFDEGAPKDRFTITNASQCSFKTLSVTIDLSKSRGQLIFDTTGAGAGVEVFQPFEVTQGDIDLSVDVKDGDSELSLSLAQLTPGASVSFTIDVDDTLSNSQLGNIQVTDSEIAGGIVSVKSVNQVAASGVFGQKNKALVGFDNCLQ